VGITAKACLDKRAQRTQRDTRVGMGVAATEQRNMWRREMAMALGLAPFLLASEPLVPNGRIGWVVVANGVATHVACAYNWRYCDYLRVVDTSINVSLCVLVNALTHWQPKSLLLTLYVLLVWAANAPKPTVELGSPAVTLSVLRNWITSTCTITPDARKGRRKQARSVGVHIVLIQWMLCFLLVVYEYKWFAP